MRSDLNPMPTMDYRKCIIHVPYVHFFLLGTLLIISVTSLRSSCISEVNVTLNGSGEAQLSTDMFVRDSSADYTLEIKNSPLSDKTKVDCSFRNSYVTVLITKISTNQQCWSTLYVEDKSDYTVSARDTFINCLMDRDSLLASDILDMDHNCMSISDLVISYVDVLDSVHTNSVDTFISYTRIWSLHDPDGSNHTVTSTIYIQRFDFMDTSIPATDTVYCPNNPSDINITGFPPYHNMNIMKSCGVMQSTIILDSVDQGCRANVKYRRLWIISDWDRDTIAIDTQYIYRIDTTTNFFELPQLSFTNNPDSCRFSFKVPMPNIKPLGCSAVPTDYISAFVNNMSVPIGDVIELPYGDFDIGYSGRDDCYNPIKLQTFRQMYMDIGPPVLNCSNVNLIAISLTDSVRQRSVRLSSIYSSDHIMGCVDASLVGRRAESACASDTAYSDVIQFCLDDTSSVVMIEIIAIDSLGNRSVSICNAQVRVDFKSDPNNIVEPICRPMIEIYISPSDSSAYLDPSSFLLSMGNVNYTSISGTASSISNAGSEHLFTGVFSSLDHIDGFSGDIKFDCSDISSYNIELSLSSSNSNDVFTCMTALDVLDSLNICNDSGMLIGNIYAWGTHPLEGVLVDVYEGDNLVNQVSSDAFGAFESIEKSNNNLLRVDYPDNWYDHLTSNDLYLLEQIVTGVMKPSSMERMTADIDRNGVINGIDYVLLKKLILGYDLELSSEQSPWIFYNGLDSCQNVSSCGNDMIPVREDQEALIHGLKKGDIDGDVTNEMELRNIRYINMMIDPDKMPDHDLIDVVICTDEINQDLLSFQLEILIPHAQNIEMLSKSIEYNYSDGVLRLVYVKQNGSIIDDIRFRIEYESNAQQLCEHVEANSAYNNLSFSSNSYNKVIVIKNSDDSNLRDGNIDFTIYPNPTSSTARIKINHNTISREPLHIAIYNELGELVSNRVYDSMYLDRTIEMPAELSKGVYSIMIQKGTSHKIKKYIKI